MGLVQRAFECGDATAVEAEVPQDARIGHVLVADAHRQLFALEALPGREVETREFQGVQQVLELVAVR